MTTFSIVVVPIVLTALLLFACAYAIGVRGHVHLIAGYDARRVRDRAGLARWFGGGLFWLGGVALGLALAPLLVPGSIRVVIAGCVATLVIGCLVLAIGARRYRV
jgi:hypothetical protein